MKKLLFGLACAATLAGAANNIESANVVGYTKIQMPANQYVMVGIQFTDCKTGTTIALSDLIQGTFTPGSVYAEDWTSYAPMIKYWDGSKYVDRFYVEDAYDEANDEDVLGWADGTGDLAPELVFQPGMAIWFKVPSECNLNTSGQVLPDASRVINLPNGSLTMVGNPYPMDLAITKINCSALTAGSVYADDWTTYAPMIKYWDGSKYVDRYYVEDAYDETNDEDVLGWADGTGDLANDLVIPVGKAFWLKATSDNASILINK